MWMESSFRRVPPGELRLYHLLRAARRVVFANGQLALELAGVVHVGRRFPLGGLRSRCTRALDSLFPDLAPAVVVIFI